MNEKEKANEKRLAILRLIHGLTDQEILDNDNFCYWGHRKVITSNSHDGNGNPPTPPPPPSPPPGQ